MGCIDGLRGFLALGVFLYHCVIWHYYIFTGIWRIPYSSFYLLAGHVGVALFFMITGFLFWHKLWNARGPVNWRKLYTSRIFRLVPLYFLAITIVTLTAFLVGGFNLKVSILSFLKSIIQWLLFFKEVDINKYPNTAHILGGMQWTLKYEWFFYLSLPILAIFIRFGKKRPIILWSLVALILVGMKFPTVIGFGINTEFFAYFMIGALTAILFSYDKLKSFFQKKWISIIALLSLCILFLFFEKGKIIYAQWIPLLLLTIFFIPIALGNSLFGLLKIPEVIILGESSYGIYLLHGIILYYLAPIFFIPSLGLGSVYIGMCAIGIVLICVACTVHLLIEKPFMEFGKKIARRF
jgi:peptidoglycan/LPS O-acetylase OafA/YrhL